MSGVGDNCISDYDSPRIQSNAGAVDLFLIWSGIMAHAIQNRVSTSFFLAPLR